VQFGDRWAAFPQDCAQLLVPSVKQQGVALNE
jgi:hypothetical protein